MENSGKSPLLVLSLIDGLGIILDTKVVIPISHVLFMVISILQESSNSLISQLLDIKLMLGQVTAENVLNLISLFEFQSFKIDQILDG